MIEEYNNLENSVFDTPYLLDASVTTTKTYFYHKPEGEREDPQQTRYIT